MPEASYDVPTPDSGPTLNTNSPDLDPSSPMNSQPSNAPLSPLGSPQQPPQSPQKPPSRWELILSGALTGLAASAGQRSFAGGLAAGAGGVQQAEERRRMMASKEAEIASQIRFRDEQSAHTALQNTIYAHQIEMLPQTEKYAQEQHNQATASFLQKLGITPDIAIPDEPNAATAAAQMLQQKYGSVPPTNIVRAGGHYLVYTGASAANATGGLDAVNRLSVTAALPEVSQDAWKTMKLEDRSKLFLQVQKANTPDADHDTLPQSIARDQNVLATLQQTRSWDRPAIAQVQQRLDIEKASLSAHSKQIEREARTKAQIAAENRPDKIDSTMYFGSLLDGSQVAGTAEQLKSWGASGQAKLPVDETKKVVVARQMIAPDGLFNSVRNDLATLQQQGKLGVVASRWSEFMAGKVGAEPEFAPLRTHMGLLATALMQAHVGARGSHEMLEHFKSLADYRISDAATLGSALNAEFSYVREKAMLPKGK